MTVAKALHQARVELSRADIASASLDARLIVGHALGLSKAALIAQPETPLDGDAIARIDGLVGRRTRREPLAYILGWREFWSLPFRVDASTLIPRPDSETILEAALSWLGGRTAAPAILDLGTGSGCLILSLLKECPDAWGVAVDRSPATLRVARANADALDLAHRVAFVCSDWAHALSGRFELIVCNPPYVSTECWRNLPADIRDYEPAAALDGGGDGLSAYRQIVPQFGHVLAPGGAVFLEVGDGMADAVAGLVIAQGLQCVETRKDLSGRIRCIVVST